jgi:hypothetical protein
MNAKTTLAVVGWAAGIAVLAFSVPAKLLAWSSTTQSWPMDGRWTSRVASPEVVTAAEAAVLAAAVAPLAVKPRLAAIGGVYAVYTGAAVVMLGRRCGCFGSKLTTRFTMWHVGGDALVAGLSLAAAAGPPPSRRSATLIAATTTAVGAVAGVTTMRRLRGTPPQRAPVSALPTHAIDHVVIYGTDTCPYCATLWDQQDYYRMLADRPVTLRKLDPDDKGPAAAQEVPAAVGYNAHGDIVAGPVYGLSEIRDLLAATTGTAHAH